MTEADLDNLGSLPVAAFRRQITDAVETHRVTVITAETGAGKSTQVPQFLAMAGYFRVVVTQPRILAARTLSMRVREEFAWRLGRDADAFVGYRTARERDDGPDNRILFCTDGLQLVRELTGAGMAGGHVLVLDEVHEWNENMEVLVAWSKRRLAEDPNFRVVLMSATLEAQALAEYFDGAPVIEVPGRTYPVERRHGEDMAIEIRGAFEAGPARVLAFLPGKPEIEAMAATLRGKLPDGVPIIPLHGQLEPGEQARAFNSFDVGKVVLTTNVAQTSVTVPDIDVVIDSGLERRSEVRQGVEGLFIAAIARADCLQRAGRAGRTKPGRYVLASLGGLPCPELDDRPAFGVPEIMRTLIDRTTLRLAAIGIDIADLKFFHSPNRRTVRIAKQTLTALDALSVTGRITEIGRRMERFPVASSFARMLVEAENCPQPVKVKLAAIIAIQEAGGIVKGSARYTGWRQLTRQTNSDLLAQYDVYLALPRLDPATYDELGIIAKNVARTNDVLARLAHDLGLDTALLGPIGEADREPLLRCIVAGQLHQLWLLDPDGKVTHIVTRQERELSSGSVVRQARIIAGTPFDLEVQGAKGLTTLRLVNDVTAVEPRWLAELAPDRFELVSGKTYFDHHYGTLAMASQLRFGGKTVRAASTPILDRSEQTRREFVRGYASYVHDKLVRERKRLEIIGGQRIPDVPIARLEAEIRDIAPDAVSLLELTREQRQEMTALTRLDNFFEPGTLPTLPKAPTAPPRRPRARRPGPPKKGRR